MKHTIELGKEYPMRGGGVFVIHFIDPLYGYLIGRRQYRNSLEWEAGSCLPNGRIFPDKEDRHDIMFPRTVMVPVEIPADAVVVHDHMSSKEGFRLIRFWGYDNPPSDVIPIEEWIASLDES